jgi:hypothetical protein
LHVAYENSLPIPKTSPRTRKKDRYGYDTVNVWGIYNGYEVYSAACKEWHKHPVIKGYPDFILASLDYFPENAPASLAKDLCHIQTVFTEIKVILNAHSPDCL